jgi:hypothetical protein
VPKFQGLTASAAAAARDSSNGAFPISSVVLSPDQAGTGITNVHSASDKVSPFAAYNTW